MNLPVLLSLAFAAALPAADFEFYAVNDLQRVFSDGHAAPQRAEAVSLFGIRGEVVSGQCVLRAGGALESATVRVSGLKGPGVLPPHSLAWNFVGDVNIPKNTLFVGPERLTRVAPARFPDYLMEERSLAFKAGERRGVWLTVRIPKDAAPGDYQGSVTAETSQGSASVPLRLTVFPLDMPDRAGLKVSLWYSTGRFDRLHGAGPMYSDKFWEMLKTYAAAMADHRQNVFRLDLSTVRISQDAGGKLSFDFSRFDRWADIFWTTGRMDWLEIGPVAHFGEGRFYSRDIVLSDYTARGPAGDVKLRGDDCLPHLLPSLVAHLKEKGWLHKTLAHISDEPTIWNVRSWREASKKVHQWAPELRRIDAIEGTGFHGELEVWVPKMNHLAAWFDVYKKAQEQGAELWYYSAMPLGNYPNRYIDYPLIETRIMHWLNYRFGVDGFLHWGLNQWTDNPVETAMEANYGAADGWVTYPKRDGLMPSVRWETMRAGLQDYEYLKILEGRIAALKQKLGAGFEWIEPERRGVELSIQVIADFGEFTRDPAALYGVKRKVIDEILSLDREPQVYVQTIPRDGEKMVRGTGRIEIRGWAAPGVEILVENRKIPVDPNGFFADAPQYFENHQEVTVRALSAAGQKILRRGVRAVR